MPRGYRWPEHDANTSLDYENNEAPHALAFAYTEKSSDKMLALDQIDEKTW